MIANQLSAAEVAFAVGYESASQFSREYKRLFGAPPGQDTERAKARLGESTGKDRLLLDQMLIEMATVVSTHGYDDARS
jgi:AraC-like DNA-binding protein